MEQELVGQKLTEKQKNQSKKEKKLKNKEGQEPHDALTSLQGKNVQKNELISQKLDLENNGGYEEDFTLDSTTPAPGETNLHKTTHYEKIGSLKNKDSARSTSATLFALDSSRVEARLLKSEAPKLPLYLGCHKPILWFKKKPILTIGPHWQYTLCLWISISISGYLLAENVAINIESKIWYYLLYTIMGLLLFFFTLTSLLNPGIAIEREQEVNTSDYLGVCPLCEIVLDNNTFHCMDCRVCIRGFDHHCPWTSKCIGANNLHTFYIFLGFFFIYFLYSMILCIVYAY